MIFDFVSYVGNENNHNHDYRYWRNTTVNNLHMGLTEHLKNVVDFYITHGPGNIAFLKTICIIDSEYSKNINICDFEFFAHNYDISCHNNGDIIVGNYIAIMKLLFHMENMPSDTDERTYQRIKNYCCHQDWDILL